MPLAGAGFGAARALEEILADRFEAEKLQALIAEREQQAQLDRERFEETKRNNEYNRKINDDELAARKAAQQAAADKAATGDRALLNMANVASMPGLDPQTAKREIAFSARDPKLMMEAMKPPAVVRDPIADHEARAKIDAQYRMPQRPERDPIADHEAKLKLDQKYKTGAAGEGPSPYAAERAQRSVDAVDRILGKVDNWTAGAGSMLAAVPGTDARNFQAELNTLKANIAFNELAAMREASKTGGALGAVSDREMGLLQSVLGGLDAGQSPENLREQLQLVKDSIQRWQTAGGQSNTPMRPATSRSGVESVPRPATGAATPPAGGSLYEQYLKRRGGG